MGEYLCREVKGERDKEMWAKLGEAISTIA